MMNHFQELKDMLEGHFKETDWANWPDGGRTWWYALWGLESNRRLWKERALFYKGRLEAISQLTEVGTLDELPS